MSGYVLSRSLDRVSLSLSSLFKFYLARLFRIYPALLAACLLAAVYMMVVRPHLPVSGASKWYIVNAAKPRLGLMLSTFTGRPTSLLPPMWSIKVEMIASLVIPFIAVFVRRGFGGPLLAIALYVGFHTQGGSLLIFLPSFVLGSLARHIQIRYGWLFRSRFVLWFSLFAMLFFRTLNPKWRFEVDYNAFIPLVVESLCASIFILGLVERRCIPLQGRHVTRLGDISYSIYLLHFTVMSVCAGIISLTPVSATWRCIILMLVTLTMSWPISSIFYDKIELPGIALGKILYAKLTLRPATLKQ